MVHRVIFFFVLSRQPKSAICTYLYGLEGFFRIFFIVIIIQMLKLFGSNPNAVSDEVLNPECYKLTIFRNTTLHSLKVSL